jgi:hypothetical protein
MLTVTRGNRSSSLDYREDIEKLRANAARCRELSTTASDSEVAQALLAIASEIDAAVPILEDDVSQIAEDDN